MHFRTLATDFDGRVGFRIDVGQAALHRVVAGHSVVADDGGNDLCIETVWRKAAIPCAKTWVHATIACDLPGESIVLESDPRAYLGTLPSPSRQSPRGTKS